VDVYNATLPKLPKVQLLNEKRRRLIRTLWKTDERYQDLEFVRDYFEECQEDPFLNGTGPYGAGHENWGPTFDYLLRADVVTRVFERAVSRGAGR
jgi:hypothetical protein